MRPCVFPVIDHAKSSRSSLHSPVRLYYYYALHLFSMYTSLVHSVFYIFILRSFSLLLSPHRFAYLAKPRSVFWQCALSLCSTASLFSCAHPLLPLPPSLPPGLPCAHVFFQPKHATRRPRSCRCIGSLTGWLAGNAAVCQYVQDGRENRETLPRCQVSTRKSCFFGSSSLPL